MDNTPQLRYIAACTVADGSHSLDEQLLQQAAPLPLMGRMPMMPSRVDGADAGEPADAAVVGGNIVAFAEGVSPQSKDDVMDSLLLATLVANKAFNPETQGDQWYGKYNESLAMMGWLSSHWRYSRYRATQKRFSMDEVGLEILGSAIAAAALPGPASIAMLKVAKDAVTALSAKKEPLRLFEKQAKTHRGGSFRIASCVESEGVVNLAMAGVSFQADSEVTNVLFWEWQDSQVESYLGENSLVFNTRVYAGVRAAVQEKLGANAKSAIAAFDI